MKLLTFGVAVFLVATWFVLVFGYTECDRGGCGDGYPVAQAMFYVLFAALVVLIVASVVRWVRRRRSASHRLADHV
jgi:hypothetical protein